MSLWTYLGWGGKPRRVVAYFLQPLGGERWEPIPAGTLPAPPKRYEAYLRDTHDPADPQFIVDVLDGAGVAVLWAGNQVEAICFDTLIAAEGYAGFAKLSREELASTFDHFDGWLTGQVKPLRDAAAADRYDFV